MSALPDTPSVAAVRSEWLLPGALLAGTWAVLFALFWPTFVSMAEIWERSETFAHGYLVFPISAWLVWRKRDALAAVRPGADPRGLVLLALAGAAWLLADAGSVKVVAQYAFIGVLLASVLTLVGWPVVRTVLFPLLFLFFAVPVGEFLIQPLMGVTADFTVALLQLTGIPVYREGMFFSIPSGDWSVVEGCSGLRYLIASVTLGVLYAYLTYRSWQRRVLFAIAAVIVPILANSGRAYMIVMIAHLSDMKLAVGVDHFIYGWVFFGLVMLLLFWIGSFWREDIDGAPSGPQVRPASRAAALPAWPAAVLTVAMAGVWPAYSSWLDARAVPPVAELRVEARGGWAPSERVTSWVPHWVGADRQLRQTYVKEGRPVLLELNYYATQRQDAELVNSQNFMIQQKDPVWGNTGESITAVTIAGQSRQVRQATLRGADGQRLLVWQWNVIDGRTTVNDLEAKLILAADRLRLAGDDGLSVLIATPYDETGIDAAAGTLARFAAEMSPAIARTLERAGGT